jgi:hypothetical protein
VKLYVCECLQIEPTGLAGAPPVDPWRLIFSQLDSSISSSSSTSSSTTATADRALAVNGAGTAVHALIGSASAVSLPVVPQAWTFVAAVFDVDARLQQAAVTLCVGDRTVTSTVKYSGGVGGSGGLRIGAGSPPGLTGKSCMSSSSCYVAIPYLCLCHYKQSLC